MQGSRLVIIALKTVHRPESSEAGLVVAGTEVVHSEGGIPGLAGVAVVVGGAAGLGEELAVGVVVVGVSDAGGRAGGGLCVGTRECPAAVEAIVTRGQ